MSPARPPFRENREGAKVREHHVEVGSLVSYAEGASLNVFRLAMSSLRNVVRLAGRCARAHRRLYTVQVRKKSKRLLRNRVFLYVSVIVCPQIGSGGGGERGGREGAGATGEG